MKLTYTNYFKKRLKKRVDKNHVLKQKVGKQLQLLLSDFGHPSLKTHKLKGERANEYAVWIEGDLRVTFIIIADEILLTDLITHDEY